YLLADRRGDDLQVHDGSFRGMATISAEKLRRGENVVAAQCYSRGGTRADATPRTIERGSASAGPVLHALLVGVGDYRNARPRQGALMAGEDAAVLARALSGRTKGGPFTDIHVKTLLDTQATRFAILEDLDALKSRVKPDDLLIFHLGGHGTTLAELRRKKVP